MPSRREHRRHSHLIRPKPGGPSSSPRVSSPNIRVSREDWSKVLTWDSQELYIPIHPLIFNPRGTCMSISCRTSIMSWKLAVTLALSNARSSRSSSDRSSPLPCLLSLNLASQVNIELYKISLSLIHSALNNNIQSINSQVNPDDFPCTWGTFDTICQVVQYLPAGLQAAVRDVAEAYQTIPLHPSQWPRAVVRLSDESLVVDTNLGFGYGPAAGGYGHLGDAGSDIMRAHGIGPLSKWVDDTIFFQIPKVHLEKYNAHRKECARRIQEHGGRVQEGCRTWY